MALKADSKFIAVVMVAMLFGSRVFAQAGPPAGPPAGIATSTADKTDTESKLGVWSSGNRIFVRCKEANISPATLEVFNLQGQLIYTDRLMSGGVVELDLHNFAGSYLIVKLFSINDNLIKNIFIRSNSFTFK